MAQSEMPIGVVTFVFTDIEGSTRLVQELGSAWTAVLAEQRRLLRVVWQKWRGNERGTEGDSFFVAFSSPTDAVSACAEAQRAIADHEWPGGVTIRVRMGMDTGEPTIADNDYIGIDIHRAARIAATGHGGQVVLGKATVEAAVLPAGVTLRDLGEHRLKDLDRPEWIYQLVIEGLPSDHPPLRSLETPTNLPAMPSALLGRERELREMGELLAHSDVRLVTATGPGGTGKTRLAVAVAEAARGAFANGVYFVSLAALTHAGDVLTEIAKVLSIELGTQTAAERLATEFRTKTTLLLLDNFEQVIDAAPDIGALLAAAPRVKALVTSRTRLNVAGEREYPVDPLPPTAAEALFLERARAVRPSFEPTPAVAEICTRLDGLPLVIELAAARAKTLSAEDILKRLGSRLSLPKTRTRDAPERQQTVRATIAWSVDLLPENARALFARLAVFYDGARLEAVESVLASAVLDDLETLVEHSLVRFGGRERYWMLETIREYAAELLEASAGIDEIRLTHATYYAAFAEDVSKDLRGPEAESSRNRLAAERANIRAALEWSLHDSFAGGDRALIGARIAAALGWYWYARGDTIEGEQWIERARAQAPHAPPALQALLMNRLGIMREQLGRPAESIELFRASRDISAALGDEAAVAKATNSLASSLRSVGDSAAARTAFEEALATWERLGEAAGQTNALANLGSMALDEHDGATALSFFSRAEEIDRAQDDEWALALDGVGIGEARLMMGNVDEGERCFRSSLRTMARLDEQDRVAEIITLLGGVAAIRGDLLRSARLGGAGWNLWTAIGTPPVGPDLAKAQRQVEDARRTLSPEEFKHAWDEGEAMTLEQAVAHALGDNPADKTIEPST